MWFFTKQKVHFICGLWTLAIYLWPGVNLKIARLLYDNKIVSDNFFYIVLKFLTYYLFLVEAVGGKALPCVVDIRDEKQVQKAIDDTIKKVNIKF